MKLSAAAAVTTTDVDSLVYLADKTPNEATYDTKKITVANFTSQLIASSEMTSALYSPISQTLSVIDADFTLSAYSNGRSYEDVRISQGKTVTVPPTSTWSVL